MSQGKRYKFNGSKFKVQVGYVADTPPQAITDITSAAVAVVTSAGHGLEPGDVAKLSGIVGMTQLNDQLVVPDDIDTDTFEASGVDSSGYAAYKIGRAHV